MSEVAEFLSKIIGNRAERVASGLMLKGIAKDINETKGSFTLSIDGEPSIPNVSMNAHYMDGGYFLVIPEADSPVIVGYASGKKDCFLVSASKVLRFKMKIGSFEVSLDKDTFKAKNSDSEIEQTANYTKIKKGASIVDVNSSDISFNGGSLGGLVKVSALVADLNALKTAYNSHTHQVIIPPHVTPITVVSVPTASAMTPSTLATLENPKVKH